jgi:RNA polymerase sigma factor (sigma-70 family)
MAWKTSMDKTSLNNWFAREVLVHEAALLRYLARVWPNRHEIHDFRQDIYVRVYEAAKLSRPTSAKGFLFSTARNLLIDRVRRSRIVTIKSVGDFAELNVLTEEVTPEREFTAGQELARLARAFRRLPPREREVIWLRRVDELPQKQVAQHLGISEKTVETHLRRALQTMANSLYSKPARREQEPAHDGEVERAQGWSFENDYSGKRQRG